MQEIVVAKGHILELLRPEEVKLQSVLSVDVFGEIRALLPFRLTGGSKDYLVVGSDSGRIVILEYNVDRNRWDRVHQETFGRSGCRRIVPGEMLAVDPKGRAVMIAAVEKQKFVYVLNRDTSNKLTISSPLEAHKSHTLCYSVVGIDVGFENPLFAVLELDYSECDTDSTGAAIQRAQKHLTFYELDLGLNHVVRKWSDPVDNKSNMLIAIPGGNDGPGGVLVCSEDWITYKNQGHTDKRVRIPRRRAYGDTRDNRGILIVAAAVHRQRTAGPFFLLQSELGDLYKVTLDYVEDNVKDIKIKYFDTVPVATALCVLRTGFLFVAAEYGNHVYYQIQSLGDDEEPTFKLENDDNVYFKPRPLKNLIPADEIQSIAPIIDCKVLNLLNEEIPQIYCLCGRGSRSSLRILRHGIASTELGTTATNLSTVTGIYTIKRSSKEYVDRYILISFEQATLVLQVSDSITEVTDSRLSNTNATLAAGLLGDDGIVQVHTDGIRHTKSDGRTQEWKPPGGKKILRATCNTRQVFVSVTGGDLYYFELDMAGNLVEVEKFPFNKEIVALELPPVQENRTRARFVAIADGENKLRIHSLEGSPLMNQLAVQALPERARSLCMTWMSTSAYESTETLYLAVGTENGLLLRITIDPVTGQLSDTRARFAGTKPTKVQRIRVREQNAILVVSSRAWLIHNYQGRIQTSAISYRPMEHAAGFSSEACPEAVVCIAQNALRIWTLERLDESFNQVEIPLRYTPRRFDVLPGTNLLCILEAEHNTFPYFERQKIKERLTAEEKSEERVKGVVIKRESGDGDAMEVDGPSQNDAVDVSASRTQTLPIEQQVDPRPGIGRWASCIRLLDVHDLENVKTTDLVELEDNEACVSMCTCKFHDHSEEVFLCVGTVKDLVLEPKRQHSGGFIHVYRYQNDNRLTLVHKTPVEEVPGALCAFQGRLLAGVGRVLRIYDLGKKKLLRKCENKNFPNQIVSIHVISHRIIVGDVQESIHFVKYLKPENTLVIYADDISPRWLTSIDILDFDTIVGGDKFGNAFVLRLPDKVSQEVEDDVTGSKAVTEMGQLNGAPFKVDLICGIFLNEAITKVLKTSLTRGGAEVILYTTISGAIGCLLPFQTREDVDFFSKLEMHMRQENPPLCGRDHLHYRSYYFPVKNVIDGDLCEQYPSIEHEKQRKIAEDLERSPAEVQKKLEDMRNML